MKDDTDKKDRAPEDLLLEGCIRIRRGDDEVISLKLDECLPLILSPVAMEGQDAVSIKRHLEGVVEYALAAPVRKALERAVLAHLPAGSDTGISRLGPELAAGSPLYEPAYPFDIIDAQEHRAADCLAHTRLLDIIARGRDRP